VPNAQHAELERLPPSWDKLKKSAEEAKTWLDLIFLIEAANRHAESSVREEIIEGIALLCTLE